MGLAESEFTCNFLLLERFGLLMAGLRALSESCVLTPAGGVGLFYPEF